MTEYTLWWPSLWHDYVKIPGARKVFSLGVGINHAQVGHYHGVGEVARLDSLLWSGWLAAAQCCETSSSHACSRVTWEGFMAALCPQSAVNQAWWINIVVNLTKNVKSDHKSHFVMVWGGFFWWNITMLTFVLICFSLITTYRSVRLIFLAS